MTQQKIKLPRSSYDELKKTIMAYGKLGEPSTLAQVSQLSTIGRTSISNNNAFLAAVGVIQGGKYKSITSAGADLATALEHGIADEIQDKWAVIVNEDEFLSKMLQAIGIRSGMEVSELETHIAYSAGESKTPAVMTGARAVVDILRESGLVDEDNGRASISDTDRRTYRRERDVVREDESTDVGISKSTHSFRTDSDVRVEIQLRINATPEEMDGLGEKIRDLLDSLSATDSSSVED